MDNGLSSEEALERTKRYGPNTLPEEKSHSLIIFLQKFWAPIPWLLEMIIVLEVALGKYHEAWIISALLLFNASLSFFQEKKAKKAVSLLKSRLDVQARALRDGRWKLLSARDLVPDDVIRIRMGDILPADIEIVSGFVSVDQSALTGESLPVELKSKKIGYAGSIVNHGEAFAKVNSTGKNTYYGKTAEIVNVAKTPSHLQQTIFLIIKYLIAFDVILVFSVFSYAIYQGLPLIELLPFSLLLLVASVPVALPATYTLATALGSLELGGLGVLVTRLSAIEEAAAMNILCLDKTGTITQNALFISRLMPFSPYTNDDLICLASLACEEATQDPLDLAILKTPGKERSPFSSAKRLRFIPFDPDQKCSEALIQFQKEKWRVLKGSPAALLKGAFSDRVEELSANGSRVLAVMAGLDNDMRTVGLIAFADPPRADAKKSIQEIQDLGIKIIMITGDTAQTALSVAKKVGLGENLLSREEIRKKDIRAYDIITGVLPEDKFNLINLLQKEGNICGMTGDGVNDAPALKKAEVGIAMSNATDVAKASASLVLTKPGLAEVIEAIKTSRRIYQRMLTYTMNKIIKTLEIAVLLSLGLVFTQHFIISQLLIIVLLFTNDFVTMSISTDKVSFSPKPDKWDIRKLLFRAGILAACILGFSFSVLFFGIKTLHLTLDEIRSLIFITLVYTGQATVYLIRERQHFWHSRPSFWMLSCSLLDIAIISMMALLGILMAPLSAPLVFGLFASIIVYFFLLDFIKVELFKKDGRSFKKS